MKASTDQNTDILHAMPPLLLGEKADEFASICEKLDEEIRPNGIVERMYVREIADRIWEIMRYRRYKTVIINSARLAALRHLLTQLLCPRDFNSYLDHEEAVDQLAYGWFESEKGKTEVAELLRKFQMDEGAIEAEAFIKCSEDLERLDRISTALEFRRDKALRNVADYRQSLAKQLQQSSNRILDHDEIPRLVSVHKKPD
jgi:hypothetical protein